MQETKNKFSPDRLNNDKGFHMICQNMQGKTWENELHESKHIHFSKSSSLSVHLKE